MSEIFKVMSEDVPYFVANVTPFRDERLSWKAKGLMTYFIDKPANWTFRMTHLVKAAKDQEKAVISGLKELKTCGYLVRVAFRKGNRVDHYGYLVYPTPVEYPTTKDIHVNDDAWKDHLQNGGYKDITLFVDEQKKKKPKTPEKSQVAQKGEPEKTPENLRLPKKVVPQKGGSSKSGHLLSTYSLSSINLLSSTYDDDAPVSSKVAPWESSHQYIALNEIFQEAGADPIKKHEDHFQKYLEIANKVGFGKLMQAAEEFIKKDEKGDQIVYFLSGAYNRYLPTTKRETVQKKKTVKKERLPESFKAESIETPKLNEEESQKEWVDIQAKLAQWEAQKKKNQAI